MVSFLPEQFKIACQFFVSSICSLKVKKMSQKKFKPSVITYIHGVPQSHLKDQAELLQWNHLKGRNDVLIKIRCK